MTWEAAWQEGRTGWDAGAAAPELLELLAPTRPGAAVGAAAGSESAPRGFGVRCRFDALLEPDAADRHRADLSADQAPSKIRVLVPGAGAGYDVLALTAPHRHVLGLDLAPTAKTRFDALMEQHPPAGEVDFWVQDFFTLGADPRWPGPLDAVWDYTFFCALDPKQRPAWARAMAELIRPGGVLITLMFPLIEDPASGPPVDRNQGPPFPLTQGIYVKHLQHPGSDGERLFRLESQWPVTRSHPGREGKEKLAIWRRAG